MLCPYVFMGEYKIRPCSGEKCGLMTILLTLESEALWSATIHCRFRRRELIHGVSKTAKNEDAQGKAAMNRRTPKHFTPHRLYFSL